MGRVKLELPESFVFHTAIPVRITDINYGGHAGNDTILSIIHEARMQYLRKAGFSEMDFGGTGMIMSDVTIEFKGEVFYGDTILASVTVANPGKVNFDFFYKLEKEMDGKRKAVAFAKTGMVCFDYGVKKIAGVPAYAYEKLERV